MKVKELIAQLEGMDADAEVHVAYDYGDHWNTTVAPTVSCVEEAEVVDSGYHRMPKVVDGDRHREDVDDDIPVRDVVVISAVEL